MPKHLFEKIIISYNKKEATCKEWTAIKEVVLWTCIWSHRIRQPAEHCWDASPDWGWWSGSASWCACTPTYRWQRSISGICKCTLHWHRRQMSVQMRDRKWSTRASPVIFLLKVTDGDEARATAHGELVLSWRPLHAASSTVDPEDDQSGLPGALF